MSKTSETKNKILSILKKGNKRLVDLYPVLGLSPATVSQHLREMKERGMIYEVDNSHFKNEKYYTLDHSAASNNDVSGMRMYRNMKEQLPKFGIIGAVAIAAVLAAVFYANGTAILHQSKLSTLNILLTDPPHVPLGTTSLNVTYSSMRIHLVNASQGSWTTVNSSGTVDLLSLVNVSKMIGTVKVPYNAIIDSVAFNITNAYIRIYNTTYPVYLNGSEVVGQVSNSNSFNGASNLLVDFSPTIVPIYNYNSTIFEMVPSFKALLVDKQQFSSPILSGPGKSKEYLINGNVSAMIHGTGANIETVNGSIAQSGRNTLIKVTVKDVSNSSVYLHHVLVMGNESLYFNASPVQIEVVSKVPGNKGIFTGNISGERVVVGRVSGNTVVTETTVPSPEGSRALFSFREGRFGGMMFIARFNFSNVYNWTSGDVNYSWSSAAGVPPPVPDGAWTKIGGLLYVPTTLNRTASPDAANEMGFAYEVGMTKQNLGVLCFTVAGNGTMVQPSMTSIGVLAQDPGYLLLPGQSVTLAFNGTIGLGSGFVTANFTKGSVYGVNVVGTEGAYSESAVRVS